jgi:hypothetical protein
MFMNECIDSTDPSGCESQGSTALDSWMGTDYGIYPWVGKLVMGNLVGRRFGKVVDGFF